LLISTFSLLMVFIRVLKTNNKIGRAIPVTGREGPQDCETLRLPLFVDNRLTDDGEIVSLTRRPPFNPQEDLRYSFLLEAESTPRATVPLEGLDQLKSGSTTKKSK
jgi:hypothetical protein